MGIRRMALTDRNGLYGIPHFIRSATEAGVEPIIGAEAVTDDHRAVLLVRTAEGYANLCRLLSDLHCREHFCLARSLAEYRDGLCIITDHRDLLTGLRRQSREDLFVELSPGHAMHRALALSRETGIPPVATTRAVMLGAQDYELHRVLRAIALNTKLSRIPEESAAAAADILAAPGKMAEFFPHCPEALDNTLELSSRCRTSWEDPGVIFPRFDGLDDDSAFRKLEKRALAGAHWRYGQVTGQIRKRFDRELGLIRAKGFAHYFLVVEELAKRSPGTCGRGSAAASLVAYCLGITHVDPLKYNLFFERFLNEGRADPPDIDVDFPWDERDDILDFAFARYGAARTAMVANQVSFRSRGALREVAKVFGIPADEIKDVTRRMSGYGRSGAIRKRMADHPLFKGERVRDDWEKIIDLASSLDGQLRHLSLHCGGLIIVPDEIRKYVPVEVTAKGMPAIQWEKDQAEAAGLVKIDILGNRSLAVIRDALEAIRRNCGRTIDYAAWQPLEDPAACTLIREGRTMGCFYIESPATRQLLERMWGREPHPLTMELDLFEHLVMASSIIRPAANNFILEFVARMRGKKWRSLHPLLDEVLAETYGIAVYQEQITRMAMVLAGFTAHEGDILRKIVTKKHQSRKLEDLRSRFMQGGSGNKIPEKTLHKCWQQILSFSGYSFCKPHSASYALVSCKSAWLKANYPAEFMAAVISNQGGFYSPFAYLSEARRLGVKVLPPDINHSRWHYSGRENTIRMGFMQLQGFRERDSRSIVRLRDEDGGFTGFSDFLKRTRLDQSQVRLLIRGGAFDEIEGADSRPSLQWQLLADRQRGSRDQNLSLFDSGPDNLPRPPPHDEKTLLNQEIDALGMLVSRHPLSLYRCALEKANTVEAVRLREHVSRKVTMAGWWVTGKPVRTKNGEPMEFVTFEDTTGTFETTFFPRAYARFCRRMTRYRPYLLRGRVEEEFGVATLNVEWMGLVGEDKEVLST
jgi:error-prone DNA polymerase